MRASLVELMAKKASENFKFKDFSFVGFDKIEVSEEEAKNDDPVIDIEVWADIKIKYEGNPPDSYRVLNRMIQDWVEDNEEPLKKEINPKLISYLKEKYENIDISDLQEDFDDYIWEDQVDYMAEIDEENKTIEFVVDLVIEIEEDEEDEEDDEDDD